MADDAPSASCKKSSTSYSRTRAATFTSTTNAPSGSSKTSFFSSFAPRWGRSQSYTSAAATSGSKVIYVRNALIDKCVMKRVFGYSALLLIAAINLFSLLSRFHSTRLFFLQDSRVFPWLQVYLSVALS